MTCDPKQATSLKAASDEDSTDVFLLFFVQQMSKQLLSSRSSKVAAKTQIHTLVFIPSASVITSIRRANQRVISAQPGNTG